MSRVWDAFLTDQDQAHLASSKHHRIGFGERPALLLIDLYRWVFGDKPEPVVEAIKTWPGSCGLAGWEAVPHIQRLLRASREAGIPIIYSTGLGEGPGWSKSARGSGAKEPDDAAMRDRKARMNDIIDEVAPVEGEIVLRKSSPSVFWGTPLVGQLTYFGVDTLIVCGESTSGCVRAAVVDGCTNRFRMMVVEEGVFDRHQACHAINLFDMNQKYADVIGVAEAEEYLQRLKASSAGSRPEPALSGAR